MCKTKICSKDVEVLLQESESLQRKLISQEEEFRLQNQTIMSELALVSRVVLLVYCNNKSLNLMQYFHRRYFTVLVMTRQEVFERTKCVD